MDWLNAQFDMMQLGAGQRGWSRQQFAAMQPAVVSGAELEIQAEDWIHHHLHARQDRLIPIFKGAEAAGRLVPALKIAEAAGRLVPIFKVAEAVGRLMPDLKIAEAAGRLVPIFKVAEAAGRLVPAFEIAEAAGRLASAQMLDKT